MSRVRIPPRDQLWRFLTDSRTIFNIYFGLLLLESILNSYGHDLWKYIT